MADKVDLIPLADGRRLDPTTGEIVDPNKVKEKELPRQVAELSLHEMASTENRSLRDLTQDIKLLNASAVVLMYETMGINDLELCQALNCNQEALDRVRASNEFTTLRNVFLDTVEEYLRKSVRGQFALASHKAALRMIEQMDSASSDIAQKAAKDVLDRAGHRPADIVEHRHAFEDELVIRVIDDKGIKEIDVSLDA